jgi:hypothetical protein
MPVRRSGLPMDFRWAATISSGVNSLSFAEQFSGIAPDGLPTCGQVTSKTTYAICDAHHALSLNYLSFFIPPVTFEEGGGISGGHKWGIEVAIRVIDFFGIIDEEVFKRRNEI